VIPPVGDAELALVFIVIAFAAALLEAFARTSQGGATPASWDRFHHLCHDRGLSEQETTTLAVWAQRAALNEPASACRDRTLFDRFVRDRVAEVSAVEAPGSLGRRAAVENLGRLRRKLGHTPAPARTGPLSSHDVPAGVRVTVRPDPVPTGAVPPGKLVVGLVDEEGIELLPIEGEPAERAFYDACPAGRGSWVVFGRPGEAIYRFRARTLERPGIAPGALFIAHGEFLVKEERRRAPRLPLRAKARVVSVDADAARAFDAETLDVSIGGLALSVPEVIARGARLALEIALEPGKDPVPVTMRVVGSGVREIDGASRTFLNGQFVDLAAPSRTRLSAFVSSARKGSADAAKVLPQGSPAGA
jgi:hypothetical protein